MERDNQGEKRMRVEISLDGRGPEYVLRLIKPNGDYMGLGSLNGKEEAEVIRDILQGAMELAAAVKIADETPSTALRSGWRKGMKNANNIVEGERLAKFF